MADQDEVPVKVTFEYFTEKNDQKFSKPFDVKVNLDPESFDINNANIIITI